MKRAFILIVAMTCMALTAQGEERTKAQKLEVAKAKLSEIMPQNLTRAASGGDTAEPEVLSEQDETTVVGYADGGFAVVANDDMYDAVVGYSTARYSARVDGFNWWRSRVEAVMAQKVAVQSGYAIPAGLKTSVSPLVTTKWGQESPYNNQCPRASKTGNTRCMTGCVATAMAQIMNFYELPAKATGSVTYTNPSTNKNTTVSLTNTGTYDWANMLDTYTSSATTAQKNAVAKLMYHCGAAVNMDYAADGSAAYADDAAKALRTNFGYKTRYYYQGFYTSDELAEPVFQDLSDGKPCMYGGVSGEGDDAGGHEFVLDGYDEQGFVHVNWGWEGDCDGYYDIALLNPDVYSFQYYQDLVRISTSAFDYYSQWGLDAFELSYSGTTLTATSMGMWNIDLDNFTGAVKMIAERNGTKSELAIMADKESLSSLKATEYLYGYTTEADDYGNAGSTITVDLSSLSDGTYTCYPASKATTETEWHPMKAFTGEKSRYIVTIAGKKITSIEGITGSTGIRLTTVRADNGMTRVYDLRGRMVYSAPSKQFSEADIPVSGMVIIKSAAGARKLFKK